MPFIKVTPSAQDTDEVKHAYINSDHVSTVTLFDDCAFVMFSNPGIDHAEITLDSARYFLNEVDTRDTQVDVADIPERSLSSRIASALRDSFPTGASFRDLFAQFPDDNEVAISNAIADLRREKVIEVREDGTVIHKSNALTPSPDLLTEDAGNDSDLPDDTTR